VSRERLDQLLVSRGQSDSREKAQRLIRAGRVRVNGQVASKPGHSYPHDVDIELEAPERFVSRGGEKLEAALMQFPVDPAGRVAMDIGASTGGFTDCLLQHGAERVYAFDVGKGQLHWKLRQDPRVLVHEKVNVRYLEPEDVPEQPTLAVVDVSFISLTLILPAVTSVLAPGADLITLIKPQFEAGREQVGKGGVVRDPATHREVVERVRGHGTDILKLNWMEHIESPVRGPAGNIEFLAWWKLP
jgi:23S rRNA (cytidine1920-2'-O)/16S rRNA (cytidine1409-2'-O)-methyltransferase